MFCSRDKVRRRKLDDMELEARTPRTRLPPRMLQSMDREPKNSQNHSTV